MTARVGKRVGRHLYVHTSALSHLPPQTQQRVAQAEWLVGVRPEQDYNVVKLQDDGAKLSLLRYPNFFEEPFPTLAAAWVVSLTDQRHSVRRFEGRDNPPVLHRKELLLARTHERFAEYAQMTADLEGLGLFANTRGIGSRNAWSARLVAAGVRVDGHSVAIEGQPTDDSEPGLRPRSHLAVPRHKTAIARTGLSTPLQALDRHGYLDGTKTLFDYGCGRGCDLKLLERNGVPSFGWDPHYWPDGPKAQADIVNLGFVVNVIEDQRERCEVLKDAYSHARSLLVVSAMLTRQGKESGANYADGQLTRRGTFQKYFTQLELRAFVESTLETEAVAVAPGVFFVFSTDGERQAFHERRNMRCRHTSGRIQVVALGSRHGTVTQKFYAQHQALLDRLWELWLSLGREPRGEEVTFEDEITDLFGTLSAALKFLRRFHGQEPLDVAWRSRSTDLLVYLALERFEGRKRLAGYSQRLRRDIKIFFGSYRAAEEKAAAELFAIADRGRVADACAAAAEGVGALDDEHSLTVHTKYVEQLPSLLRVYIGCATYLYGDVTAADLVKIHGRSDKLTVTTFDDFEGKALPRMMTRVKLDYRRQDFMVFEYGEDYTPPYLFLKSRYIREDFPDYQRQVVFDEALEQLDISDLGGHGAPPHDFDASLQRYRLGVEGFEVIGVQGIPALDAPCGRYLRFRDFIECGQMQQRLGLANVPQQAETYNALATLTREVLDPVIDYFGGIELTYGFCSRELAKHVEGGIDPRRDQHAAHECNARGNSICSRLGAAVDFRVTDESMAEVAAWIASNTRFDRLYFYGDDRPIHVSVGPEEQRQVVAVRTLDSGRRMPQVVHDLRAFFGEELLEQVVDR